jgi:hypothetical protein
MIFENRADAGRQLSKQLQGFGNQQDVVVLGMPRGRVVVAFEIASALHAPLDIFLSRKLGVPDHEELSFGAVAAGHGLYLDHPFRLDAFGGVPGADWRVRIRSTRGDVSFRCLTLIADGYVIRQEVI